MNVGLVHFPHQRAFGSMVGLLKLLVSDQLQLQFKNVAWISPRDVALVGDQQPCLTLPSRHRSVGRVDYDNTNVIVGDDEPDFVTLAFIPDARLVRPKHRKPLIINTQPLVTFSRKSGIFKM